MSLSPLFTQYWVYLALRAACQVDLFEAMSLTQAQSSQALATSLNLHPESLADWLRALAVEGIVRAEDQGYCLTEASNELRRDHPLSLYYACLLWGDTQMQAWQQAAHSLRTGQAAYPLLQGLAFFDDLAQNPERRQHYHLAMEEYARRDYPSLIPQLGLQGSERIGDLGCSRAWLLWALKQSYPQLQTFGLELAEVLSDLPTERLQAFEPVPCNMLETLPALQLDGLLCCRILHDWPDEEALRILQNCKTCLQPNGKLWVVENLPERIADGAALLSVHMRVICGSSERKGEGYRRLFEKAGWQVEAELELDDFRNLWTLKMQ